MEDTSDAIIAEQLAYGEEPLAPLGDSANLLEVPQQVCLITLHITLSLLISFVGGSIFSPFKHTVISRQG